MTKDMMSPIFERKETGIEARLDPLPEFLGQVIDVFEDYCTRNNISIQNDDRKREGDEFSAIIYGVDYDILADEVSFAINNLAKAGRTLFNDAEVDHLFELLIDNFNGVLKERGSESILPIDGIRTIKRQLGELFENWDLIKRRENAQ